MLNYIWLGLLVLGVLLGGVYDRMDEVAKGAIEMAELGVKISIGLIGVMTLWLGMMRLAERAGLVQALARLLRPVMTRLFPDVPPEHPAMGSMLMNISANMLGLANAATPLGLRAMRDLETLNRTPGTATNAMCMFLAINTSSVQLLPVTAIAILAAAGSTAPYAIVGTAFLATVCSTVVGVASAKFLERLAVFRICPQEEGMSDRGRSDEGVGVGEAGATSLGSQPAAVGAMHPAGVVMVAVLVLAFVCFFCFRVMLPSGEAVGQPVVVRAVQALSLLAIPFLLAFFPAYAAARRIPVYEEFTEGAKEGFQVAVRIIPYLVAILVAVGMFRSAGGIEMLSGVLGGVLERVGFPVDLLPMVIMRPLSGGGTMGIFTELVNTLGPDHLVSRMAATIFGSTETTFYVITVYFGSVAVRRTRHAIAAGLLADLSAVIAAIVICRAVF